MFYFTVDELREALSNINSGTRKSLVGMYKSNDYIGLGNYLSKHNLGSINKDSLEVSLNFPYAKVEEYNKSFSTLISYKKTVLEKYNYSKYSNTNYKHLHGYYTDYSNVELKRVYDYLSSLDNKTTEMSLLLPEIIKLIEIQHLAHKFRMYYQATKNCNLLFNWKKFLEIEKVSSSITSLLINN
jgi:hypothetical protein